jgi:purine-binding chemotaxis protein CheW
MPAIMQKEKTNLSSQLGSYVIFALGSDTYGIEVMNIQEVQNYIAINHVPDTLAYMKGVINLRGNIVPIVDLRIKLGMEEVQYTDQTVIIIAELHGEKAGLIVDSVVDVLNIPASEIQHTKHFTINIDTDSVFGITKINDNIIIILNAEKIISKEEMDGMNQKQIPRQKQDG